MIEAIAGSKLADALSASAAKPTAAAGFEKMLTQLEKSENSLGSLLNDVATGQAGSLHQVMLKMEETRMQFELFMQARNKVLEAYQEVMRMQV
ncbi:flagellar hook-basal body complex protein FliE [Chromobacterium alticapitis]|uniref:Flagellar hook-basal body complex protein FliE n=1 Tax=Chromobacterium alticapitis TaxID=2073169 RepID=A0A2S5DL19_9NEIS|nr:flagellar hook-basal body complex protein FliE [Chromobacterium alticapitis]POZ63764.1 flagellar hook-basal body complex protein FliE [Chromobacterium alticapitis]